MASTSGISEEERGFLQQADSFVDKVLRELQLSSVHQLPEPSRTASPLYPVIIEDYNALTTDEKAALMAAYHSTSGVAYFVVANPPEHWEQHPVLRIATQLKHELYLEHPLTHPLENHPDLVSRFGVDGTLKVCDTAKDRRAGYREQGETSEEFLMHHDGLGSGGTVRTIALYLDCPPAAAGFTYFHNILMAALILAKDDPEAFRDLFLPNAVTITRPRGKGALRVDSPVLFINEEERPQSVFRIASGEYEIRRRPDRPALARALNFLAQISSPFAAGSSFVHFSRVGHGCFIDNERIAHGRTAFLNLPGMTERILARKWFMRTERDSTYKHVPGLFVSSQFAHFAPQLTSPELLQGEWRLDADVGRNVRIK